MRNKQKYLNPNPSILRESELAQRLIEDAESLGLPVRTIIVLRLAQFYGLESPQQKRQEKEEQTPAPRKSVKQSLPEPEEENNASMALHGLIGQVQLDESFYE